MNIITKYTTEERWYEINDNAFYADCYTRVVFAKSKEYDNNYLFLGVYKYKESKTEVLQNGKEQYVKIFERISDEYGSIQL